MNPSHPHLQFLGAADTVTGSRYLLSGKRTRLLIDCGLFQGYKVLRERNWHPFPVKANSLDGVVLTHAHLDHSGYLPVLAANGFKRKVYATEATCDLCEILWRDAAKLQEEEAEFRNRHRTTRHQPALPLFTIKQAEKALRLLRPVPFNEEIPIGHAVVQFQPNGHILGSAAVSVFLDDRRLFFSGDVGRFHDLLMAAPWPPAACDYLVVESTYGDRLHDPRDVMEVAAGIINDTVHRGGSVLIPAFAVGRAQGMLYLLDELRRHQRIPYLPIYLDSPMAISATELLLRHRDLVRLPPERCKAMCEDVHYCRTVDESRGLNHINVPAIIISASGMATGGRVLHHLKRMLPDSSHTVLFAGYQAPGTRGARLVRGETSVKIHGHYYPVKARVEQLHSLSAHADYGELLQWLQRMPEPPRRAFITHGEPEAADHFRTKLQDSMGWNACVPDHGETVDL